MTTGRELLAIGVAGVRRRGHPDPVEIEDRFHYGSAGKSLTALLLGILVEEKRISWDLALKDGLPEDWLPNLAPSLRRVHLQDLLVHRGGLTPNLKTFLGDETWKEVFFSTQAPRIQRENLLAKVLSKPPSAEPLSKWVYSNAGYTLAGYLAERATGETFEELIQEEIFEPLGMRSAGFGSGATTATLDQPWGHVETSEGIIPLEPGPFSDNPAAIAPAGRIHASLLDFGRYLRDHLRGEKDRSTLLPRSAYRELHRPRIDSGLKSQRYAMGWMVGVPPWSDRPSLWHDGSNGSFLTLVEIQPEEDRAFLVVTNQGGRKAFQALVEVMRGLHDPEKRRLAEPRVETPAEASLAAAASRPTSSP